MDDADLATHLLHMCLAKWQTQYNLIKNTTHISTRALLLVLKSIKNNGEVDYKAQICAKTKGAECKMESPDYRIPK